MSEFLIDGHIREYVDVRELDVSVRDYIHRILNKIRECEKYSIDYDAYLDKNDFQIILGVLDCCLDNKDSKYILRRDYE